MDEIFEAIAEGPMGIRLIERGKAEGKAEGKIEGKAEATAKALTILWKIRFGSVAADVNAALAHADAARLDVLLEAFATAPSEAELREMLGLPPSK